MHVLIVGGAGYIGSHVVHEMIRAGHTVTVYDNLSHGDRANIPAGVAFVHGDLIDYARLRATLGDSEHRFDAVVHLAAFKAAGESMVAPEKYATNNICGTVNLLNVMCETEVKILVFSSSAAVYGEPQYVPIDEKHPKEPENFYGFTKLEIERLMQWYDKLRGLRFAALRYFNAAGYDPSGAVSGLERNPANLLPIIMEAACGIRDKVTVFGTDYPTPDGTCIRDYVHVSDLATAHVAAAAHLADDGNSLAVNLGSESGISVFEMLEAARRITGRAIPSENGPRRPGDPAELVASSAAAQELLGWQPRHSDVESLVRTSWTVYAPHEADA